MALYAKRLAGPTQISTVFTAVYTVPANTTTVIKQIVLTNTTGSSKTASVRIKPLGVTEANTHEILSNVTLAANETLAFACSMVLTNNGSAASATNSDQLTVYTSANSSVNLTVFGTEET
jgi:hypothetical protein